MAKKPKRRHPQLPLSRGPGLEEILSRAHALQEEGKPEEALRVLDEAPVHLQRRPELLLARGLLLTQMNRQEDALSVLEEAQRRDPDNLFAYFLLGLLYMGMPAHARRALREVVEYRADLPEDMVIELEDVLDTLEEHLSDLGHRLGISPERADELDYQLELGRRMVQAEDLSAALRHFRRAASIAPHWFFPRAMEMEVLVMSDRAREAVGIGQRLLAEYPDLVPAREVLVRAYMILGNREAAEEVARPLLYSGTGQPAGRGPGSGSPLHRSRIGVGPAR